MTSAKSFRKLITHECGSGMRDKYCGAKVWTHPLIKRGGTENSFCHFSVLPLDGPGLLRPESNSPSFRHFYTYIPTLPDFLFEPPMQLRAL